MVRNVIVTYSTNTSSYKTLMKRHQLMSFMSISLAVLLSTLFAFSWSANARKDSGDYWKDVMKDEPIPTTLKALILPNNVIKSNTPLKKPAADCGEEHHAKKPATVRDDFEPRPSATAYVNHEMMRDNVDFEPRPSLTAYVNHEMTRDNVDFEPRPSLTAYVNHEMTRDNVDFEPRPSLTAYVNHEMTRNNVDFKPRPSVTAYVNEKMTTTTTSTISTKRDENNNEETKKPFLKSFEPRPNVSSYHDDDTTVVIVVEEKPANMEKVGESSSFEPRPNVSAYGG